MHPGTVRLIKGASTASISLESSSVRANVSEELKQIDEQIFDLQAHKINLQRSLLRKDSKGSKASKKSEDSKNLAKRDQMEAEVELYANFDYYEDVNNYIATKLKQIQIGPVENWPTRGTFDPEGQTDNIFQGEGECRDERMDEDPPLTFEVAQEHPTTILTDKDILDVATSADTFEAADPLV